MSASGSAAGRPATSANVGGPAGDRALDLRRSYEREMSRALAEGRDADADRIMLRIATLDAAAMPANVVTLPKRGAR